MLLYNSGIGGLLVVVSIPIIGYLCIADMAEVQKGRTERAEIRRVEYEREREAKIEGERELSRLVEEGTATLRIMKRSAWHRINFYVRANVGINSTTTRLYDLDSNSVPDIAIDCVTAQYDFMAARVVTGEQHTPTAKEIEWYMRQENPASKR